MEGCDQENLPLIHQLLVCSVDVKYAPKNRPTALSFAQKKNKAEVVKLLLKAVANQDFYNACQLDDLEKVRTFLEEAANNKKAADIINIRINGLTPLMVACQNKHEEVVDLLLDYGSEFITYEDIIQALDLVAGESHAIENRLVGALYARYHVSPCWGLSHTWGEPYEPTTESSNDSRCSFH